MFKPSLWEEKLVREYEGRELKRKRVLEELIPKLKDYFKDKEVDKICIFGSILGER